MTDEPAIEYDLARQMITYRDRKRFVEIRSDIADDGWHFDPKTITWWTRDDGSRQPVTDSEQRTITERVLAEAKDRFRRVGLVGEPIAAPRPSMMDPDSDDFQRYLDAMTRPEGASNEDLVKWIDEALRFTEPTAAQWDVTASITRQLRWCRGKVLGEIVEDPPGPLSMGLMATREFDMYGSEPEFASLINRIQSAMIATGRAPPEA